MHSVEILTIYKSIIIIFKKHIIPNVLCKNKTSKNITITSRNVPWIFHFTRVSISNETQDVYAALGW